jgi:hypothetical protein
MIAVVLIKWLLTVPALAMAGLKVHHCPPLKCLLNVQMFLRLANKNLP